jgi:DNA repair photolyase
MRWESQQIERDAAARLPGIEDAVVRRFNAPEALDMRFHEIRTKSALNRIPAGARLPFEWTVNPYRGCSHACAYCFARPTHEYLDMNAGRDFEREIIVKVNVPEVLRAELARPSWRGDHVALGTNTDPYQWVEGRYRLMRGIWEAMRDYRNPCSILTKSPLVLRDLDLLKQIAAVTEVSACLSVPTLDEKTWRATEPHTPNPRARLEAVAELNRNGIPTGVLIAPLMPGVNDSRAQVERIVAAATDANATYIGGNTLFLRGAVREIFFDWLREHRPDLVPRYERLYENRAYLPTGVKRRIELDAGAPWASGASRRDPFRARHRGGRRRALRPVAPPATPVTAQERLF